MKKRMIRLERKLQLNKETVSPLEARHISGGGPRSNNCVPSVDICVLTQGCPVTAANCWSAGNSCPAPVGGSCNTNCNQTVPLPGGQVCASAPDTNGGC